MSAHTPGPWHVSRDQAVVFGPGGQLMADCEIFGPAMYEERYANACLIAAAPDLLAACQLLEGRLESLMKYGDYGFDDPARDAAIIQARAAIAKATGEK